MAKRTCSLDGCERPRHSGGLCGMHRKRQIRSGQTGSVDTRRVIGDDVARFWSHVDKTDDCWLWTAGTGKGYGLFTLAGRNISAHVWAYEQQHGPVESGLELDHRCRTLRCVRPDHLEPVTHQVNVTRGNGWAGINARKAECVHGHAYDAANTGIDRHGHRFCRTCKRARQRAI